MARLQLSDLDFGSSAKIVGLPAATATGHPVTWDQFNSALEGIAWKDSVRVASTANITIASPGATIDGITMAANDRFLAKNQSAGAENGIYIWNGAAVPATRAMDMTTADEVEAAVVTVEEGTSAGVTFRQTAVNITMGTTTITWTTFGTAAGAASEASAGVAELATQSETDTGTDDLRIVTPLKFKTSSLRAKPYVSNVGDGSATSIVLTHNLNTRDVHVEVFRNSGNYDTVGCDIERTSVNSVTLKFATAPASTAYRAIILAMPAA